MNKLNRTAEAYATALLDLAIAEKKQETFAQNVNLFLSIWNSAKELQTVLTHPSVSAHSKHAIVIEILKSENCEKKFINFIYLLIDKAKLHLYNRIAEHFNNKYDDATGILRVKVTSAIPLTAEQKQKLTIKIKKQLDKEIKISEHIDQNIIAGLKLDIMDAVYDASIKNHLNIIKENIKSN